MGKNGDTQTILTGAYTNNTCLTAIQVYAESALTTAKFVTAGFAGSVHTCLDHALDGWSLWGVPLAYKIGNAATGATITPTGLSDTNNIILESTEFDDEVPWSTVNVGSVVGTTHKTVNMGQARIMFTVYETADPWLCFLFTSSEYFTYTHFACLKGDDADTLTAANLVGPASTANALGNTAMGATWNAWPYMAANSTAGAKLNAQTVDEIMFVGTRRGTGVITRQDFNAGIGALKSTSNLNTATTNITTSSTHYLYVDPPTGGMA